MSTNKITNNEDEVHVHNGVIFSYFIKGKFENFRKTNGSGKHSC